MPDSKLALNYLFICLFLCMRETEVERDRDTEMLRDTQRELWALVD